METKPAQNIQDSFLNNARRDRAAVTIYLVSGVKLTGRIKSFDKYSVVLDTSGNQEQLIFKHAISTVVTAKSTQGAHAERVAGTSGNASHPAAETPSHPGESQG
jgi:host factor-I protein